MGFHGATEIVLYAVRWGIISHDRAEMWLTTLERAKRLTRIVVGFTVLALGVALLVLPGPGILFIAGGLVILGAEFVWARRLLDRFKAQAQAARDAFERRRPR